MDSSGGNTTSTGFLGCHQGFAHFTIEQRPIQVLKGGGGGGSGSYDKKDLTPENEEEENFNVNKYV